MLSCLAAVVLAFADSYLLAFAFASSFFVMVRRSSTKPLAAFKSNHHRCCLVAAARPATSRAVLSINGHPHKVRGLWICEPPPAPENANKAETRGVCPSSTLAVLAQLLCGWSLSPRGAASQQRQQLPAEHSLVLSSSHTTIGRQ